MEKLNEIYDRELEHMQGIIDDLLVQVKTWKDKVLQYDKFIRTLEKQDGITCEFDAGIWSSFVQEVVAKAKDDIRFIFKNGFEVRV